MSDSKSTPTVPARPLPVHNESFRKQDMVIALVEDSRDIQRILSIQLRKIGYTVVTFDSGSALLSYLQASNRIDLILLDVMLPGMDGYETCRQVRLSHDPSILPVIMISALGDDADARIRGLDAGANDFVAKPYSIVELDQRITICLEAKAESEMANRVLMNYVPSGLRSLFRKNQQTLETQTRQHGIVLFADLRGFTALTSEQSLEHLGTILNDFFEAMMRVVEDHSGVVLDVIGDELMAVFNIPEPVPSATFLAVTAALEMQQLFQLIQTQWARSGVHIGLGIGIHEGEVLVGHIGGSALKRYTVIGNPVNLAHRLLDQAQDGQVVIARSLFEQVQIPSSIPVERREGVQLKGVSTPQELCFLNCHVAQDT